MKKTDFDEGKRILDLIDKEKKERECLVELIDRIEQTTGENSKHIFIQIAEQYLATPHAKVNIQNFKHFIKQEIERVDNNIKHLEEEFEAI